MFGISGSEFLIILIVAALVIPASKWPDVARILARIINYIKIVIGKIQDNVDNIKEEIEKEIPIDKLSQKTMDDMLETFRTPVKKVKKLKRYKK